MTPSERYARRLAFFKSRVGQRLYRSKGCPCEICDHIFHKGIIVADELHAQYLCDIEADCGYHYADTKWGVRWWVVTKPLRRAWVWIRKRIKTT